MAPKTAVKPKVPRADVVLLTKRDPVAVSDKYRKPGKRYRWAASGPGSDPSELDYRVEELEELGYAPVKDPEGGVVRKRGAILMEIDETLYTRRQEAKVERNRRLNRAQAEEARRALAARLGGQGKVLERGRQALPAEPLLSKDEHFAE